MDDRTCTIEDCARLSHRRGWCRTHYRRWERHGDPLGGGRRYATPEEAFASRTEWCGDCLVWTGAVTPKGYGQIVVRGENLRAHRYAWEREHGPIPEGKVIDHTCWNRACVNAVHLRLATEDENGRNLSGAHRDSVTGVRNVDLHRGRYRVQVRKGGTVYGGRFGTLEEAAECAERLRLELFGAFSGKG